MARKRKDEVILTRGKALGLAFGLSIILFVAGLFSGLSASKVVQEQAEQDLSFLVGYVNTLESELQSIQIQESFLNTLDEEQRCEFSERHFEQVAAQLNYYWSVFPTRLELYERNRELTPQYMNLKDEYTKLSLRAWIIARDNHQRCHSDTIPVLYFYTSACTSCPTQGEILDLVKGRLANYNKTVLAFTIDIEQEEPSLPMIKEHFNVENVPALIINDQALQGRLYSEAEIIAAITEVDE